MSDGDDGALLENTLYDGTDLLLSLGVHCRGSLIQAEDRDLSQGSTGQANQLLLPKGPGTGAHTRDLAAQAPGVLDLLLEGGLLDDGVEVSIGVLIEGVQVGADSASKDNRLLENKQRRI